MVLRDYMNLMDSTDPNEALHCMEPDLQFTLTLPTGQVQGTSRADFAAYITGRNAKGRTHHVLRQAVDGDMEFVCGVVTEDGERRGAFLSVAVVSEQGRMHKYVSFFDPDLALVDE